MSQTTSHVTVIFPLYHAAVKIPALMAGLLSQKHPRHANLADWVQVIFIDNASTDGTFDTLQTHLAKLGNPSFIQAVSNAQNLGLSGSLNKAFAMVTTPYGLTCHSDCVFGQNDYLYRMVDLMDRHPKVGALIGRSAIEPGKPLPLAEKVNLVANLMDLFPVETSDELISVGFAEGRCDIFRMQALKGAGYYDTTLRLAGEDQILAARMRKLGYEICQAPALTYYLSVSVQQDSLAKLPQHQRRFGRAHPYILMSSKEASRGMLGREAGRNRRARTFLRALQLVSTGTYALVLLLLAGVPWVFPFGMLATLFLIKTALFFRHFRLIRFSPAELATFYAYQPVLDVYYTWGLCEGVLALLNRGEAREIS